MLIAYCTYVDEQSILDIGIGPGGLKTDEQTKQIAILCSEAMHSRPIEERWKKKPKSFFSNVLSFFRRR